MSLIKYIKITKPSRQDARQDARILGAAEWQPFKLGSSWVLLNQELRQANYGDLLAAIKKNYAANSKPKSLLRYLKVDSFDRKAA